MKWQTIGKPAAIARMTAVSLGVQLGWMMKASAGMIRPLRDEHAETHGVMTMKTTITPTMASVL